MALIPYPGFIGGSYRLPGNGSAESERTMNLYPEVVESGNGKNTIILRSTPGLRIFCTLPTSPVRAICEYNGRVWAVAGTTVYEVFSAGGYTARGTISSGPTCSIACNGSQLCLISAGNGFILDLTTNAISQIDPSVTDASGFLGANQVVCIDGYFICSKPGSNTFYISGYLDGTKWDALDFANEASTGTNIVAIATVHRYLWLFAADHTVVYFDSGNADFPFEPIQGASMPTGIAAMFSVASSNDSLIWLGRDTRGSGVVYRAQGYSAVRLSTFAVEQAIQSYTRIDDAIGYTYQQDGHNFYVLNFPTAGATWVFDESTGFWHERGHWSNGKYGTVLGRSYAYAFGKSLTGDYLSGNLYVMDSATYTDNSKPIRRERTAPHIASSMQEIFYGGFYLDMETGVGLGGGEVPGTDPVAILQYSNDGGKTWSNELEMPIGKSGQFKGRAYRRRLGRSRDRVFKVVFSDPVPVTIFNAYLDLEAGNS